MSYFFSDGKAKRNRKQTRNPDPDVKKDLHKEKKRIWTILYKFKRVKS